MGSAFDTLIGVYQGAAADSLTEIVGNDDLQRRHRGSLARFTAVAGQTCHLAVDGFNGDHGNIRFWPNDSIDTRFRHPVRNPLGEIDQDIETEAGVTYLLQSSLDLKIWSDLSTVTGGGADLSYRDQSAAGTATRFYRLLLEP